MLLCKDLWNLILVQCPEIGKPLYGNGFYSPCDSYFTGFYDLLKNSEYEGVGNVSVYKTIFGYVPWHSPAGLLIPLLLALYHC